MTQLPSAEISLRVPGEQAYALVIRTMLGGVAILKDLDVDNLDDLRTAADEACDCLLHQGAPVRALELSVRDAGKALTVSLNADMDGEDGPFTGDAEMTRAVLETLIPQVALEVTAAGCIRRIDLTMPKAV